MEKGDPLNSSLPIIRKLAEIIKRLYNQVSNTTTKWFSGKVFCHRILLGFASDFDELSGVKPAQPNLLVTQLFSEKTTKIFRKMKI